MKSNPYVPGETSLAIGQIHWAIYIRSAVAGALALVLAVMLGSAAGGTLALYASGPVLILAGGLAVAAYIVKRTAHIELTNRRVILRYGFLNRTNSELFLEKTEGMTVEEDLLGRLVGYGSIIVTGTGGARNAIPYVARPHEFREAVLIAAQQKN